MKRILVLAATLAFCVAAQAQLYKYIDKDGKTVYSDQPPTNIESKQLNISSGGTAPAKSAVERDKELEKGRKEARDKQEKAGKSAAQAEDREKACASAKNYYQTISAG